MDLLFRFWAQLGLTAAGLLIGTLEFFGFPTIQLWTEILPQVRFGLGMGP